jgi:hypothetical protein
MSKLIPYEKVAIDYGWGHSRIYPTGKCKRITTKDENGNVIYGYELAQCRRRIFGIPLWTHWVNKKDIRWESEEVECYDCEELKNGE